MMRALDSYIRKSELTQVQAAKEFGVSHLFSIDNLVVLLAAAGLRVDLKIKKVARPPAGTAGLRLRDTARWKTRPFGEVVRGGEWDSADCRQ